MLRRFADRAVLVHLKDRQPNSPTGYNLDEGGRHMAELGEGNIPWRPLLEQAKQQGIRYAFLDQDFTSLAVEESMRRGRAYLRGLNV
jgi:sugar phosphate isomerase/epimerase